MEKHRLLKTCDIKRELPPWARVAVTVNGLDIYNMNVFENIMSWNRHNGRTPALDYYGTQITYRQLPDKVNEYVCAFRALEVTRGSVVTLCLPPSIENILCLLALDCIGAVANSVNFLFLRNDFLRYTKQKRSDTLVVLDAYLAFVAENLEQSEIENVVVTSLNTCLPPEKRDMFSDPGRFPEKIRDVFFDGDRARKARTVIANIRNCKIIRTEDFLALGKSDPSSLFRGPCDIFRDSEYSYTSGTTGAPKCIVFREYSTNAFIEMHRGLDTKDTVGERVFCVIPFTHATGERVSGYLQMAKGKTLVLQPLYNKEAFRHDLARSGCNWVVAAPSFYLAGVRGGGSIPYGIQPSYPSQLRR